VVATTAIGNINTMVSSFVTAWNAHLNNTGGLYHPVADTTINIVPVGFGVNPTPSTFVDFVNDALRRVRGHFTNDNGEGRDSENYHLVGAVLRNDQTNAPIVTGVGDPGMAYVGLADLYRSYTAHLASTIVHNAAPDVTNTLPSTTSAKLFELHKAVLTVLASTSPVVPDTQSTGAMYLIQLVGGEEKPL
jgi:hypothetical protein